MTERDRIVPATLAEAAAIAQRMADTPAEAVMLAGRLLEVVDELAPAKQELLSRYSFERCSLWTLIASFELIGEPNEAPPEIIRCQHDDWFRGVHAVALPAFPLDAFGNVDYLPAQQALSLRTTNNRDKFDTNWRIDASQGFISSGTGEVLAPATLVTGDGFFNVPLDWRLQKDQYIEVRVRSRFSEFQPSDIEDPEAVVLRWVVVAFWVEAINQPSTR